MIEAKAKIWLEIDSTCVIGQGRAELLQKIKEMGSLTKVAESMGMGYSHAWSELKIISDVVGGPVIISSRGGTTGGSTHLTELGEDLLTRYAKEKESLDRHLSQRNDDMVQSY